MDTYIVVLPGTISEQINRQAQSIGVTPELLLNFVVCVGLTDQALAQMTDLCRQHNELGRPHEPYLVRSLDSLIKNLTAN